MTCNMISNEAEGLAFKPGHHEEGEHVSLSTRYQTRSETYRDEREGGLQQLPYPAHQRRGNLQSLELDRHAWELCRWPY